MNLRDYPRPPADNGRGVHWSPSQYQWGRHNWPLWRDRILEMGLKWVKIIVPPDYNADALVKRLVDIDVMPVCRFVSKNPSRLDPSMEATIKRLIDLGARYFETNNEPDADVEWSSGRRPRGWEQLVIENWMNDAHKLIAMGGYPAFVAFNSGPNEPRDPIKILVDRGGGDLLRSGRIWIALHNYGKGRPLNYPNDPVRMFGRPVTEEEYMNQGQPGFWTPEKLKEFVWHNLDRQEINRRRAAQKNPNITIHQDITCFRAYEYWNELVTRQGFPSIPVMMTEGGWETGDKIDDFYPEPTARRASELNLEMFKFVQGDITLDIYQPDGSAVKVKAPDYLLAVMPWHMAEKEFGLDTSGQWEQGAWFTHYRDREFGLNGELPIVQMLRDLPTRVRADGPAPKEWSQRKHMFIDRLEDGLPKTRWDYRMAYLGSGIEVKRADPAQAHWRVIEGSWQDVEERLDGYAPPPGYLLVKVLDAGGAPLPNAEVVVSRQGADDLIRTKDETDQYWANYFMSGLLGTYTLEVRHQGLPSDKIINLGKGREDPPLRGDPTSFRFVFQLQRPGAAAPGARGGVTIAEPVVSEPPVVEPEPARPVVEEPVVENTTPTPPVAETPVVEETPPPPTTPSQPAAPENDAAAFGVTVHPLPSEVFFKVVRVHHLSPEENRGLNNLFLDVLDEQGRRLQGAQVTIQASTGHTFSVGIDKPANEPGGNIPMFLGTTYDVTGVIVAGNTVPTQQVTGFHTNHPSDGQGNDRGHHSFLVVLQRQRRP